MAEIELKPNFRSRSHRIHGYSADYPRLFSIWETMRNRCNNPHRLKYKDYGARGIEVCTEWNSAKAFCEWALSHGYSDGLQIDRIDNSGNYEPNNCRWVTPKENSRNRRNTKYLTLHNETKCVAEWCEIIPISQFTIYWWYKKYGRSETEKKVIEVWNRRVDNG